MVAWGGGGASEEDFFIRKCDIRWVTGGVTQEVLGCVTSQFGLEVVISAYFA